MTGESDEEKAKRRRPVADINVTPMVDVMLVMLIIFMVITPMLSKGVTRGHGEDEESRSPMQAADKEDAVIVAVTRDGKTYLGTDQMAPDRLARQGQRSADQPARQDGFRKADARARYERVVDVVDNLRRPASTARSADRSRFSRKRATPSDTLRRAAPAGGS